MKVVRKLRALVVGAGKIGALFDKPGTREVLTHAHAFSVHPSFELAGVVEPDPLRLARAARLWDCAGYDSVARGMKGANPDVAVVAVPDRLHYPVLREIASYSPRFVLAEKPLASTLAEARKISALYRARRIPLGVNYIRRFLPELTALRREIKSGKVGRFLAGAGFYGKGALHNGSHMVDLLAYFFGRIRVLDAGPVVRDFYRDDPSVSCRLGVGGAVFCMNALDCRVYTVFELDLLFEKRRVRITDSGRRMEILTPATSRVFRGYKYLAPKKTLDLPLNSAIYLAADAIASYLRKGSDFPSPASESMHVIETCLDICRKAGS